MLPADKWATMRQSTRPARASLTVPPILVKAANSKSVPMAKYGFTPKKKIKIGVISEPPPTPVRPTTSPTKNPANTNAKSCIEAEFDGVCLYCKLHFYDFVMYYLEYRGR